MRAAGFISQQARQFFGLARRAIPDEIVAPVPFAQIVVRPRDRIAEHLFVRRQAERKILEQLRMQRRRKILLGDQSAPCRIARIERREFGEILLAHRGTDAVGADQNVSLGRHPVGKMRDHAAALLDAAQLLAAMIGRFAQRGCQQMKDPIPRRHGLRDLELVRHAAVARIHHPRRHLDAEIRPGIEPECAQRRLQFGLRHDAGATPGERLGDAFINRHIPAAARERERREQPAHRPADHQCASRLRQTQPSRHSAVAQNLL